MRTAPQTLEFNPTSGVQFSGLRGADDAGKCPTFFEQRLVWAAAHPVAAAAWPAPWQR